MGLLLPFYDDAGLIAINEHLFGLLDIGALDADGDAVQVGDAVASLRFFVRLLELGVDDSVVTGDAIQALIEANFPQLHLFMTGQEFRVRPPSDGRFDYDRFNQNFRHLMVSFSRICYWKHNLRLLACLSSWYLLYL